jgi:hypothetical protein
MKSDNLAMHHEDIGEKVGEFYGTDIRAVSSSAVELRELDDMQQRVRMSFGLDSAPIELFPGETLTDNIIRRTTTAEAVGEAFYEDKPHMSFEESISGLQAPDYWDDYEARRA